MQEEPESEALRSALAAPEVLASSSLARVEVVLAVREERPDLLAAAGDLLASIALLPVTDDRLGTAATLPAPGSLRSLDAIHLATALSLGPDLGAVVSYDRRLLSAAERAGLVTLAPS